MNVTGYSLIAYAAICTLFYVRESVSLCTQLRSLSDKIWKKIIWNDSRDTFAKVTEKWWVILCEESQYVIIIKKFWVSSEKWFFFTFFLTLFFFLQPKVTSKRISILQFRRQLCKPNRYKICACLFSQRKCKLAK